MSANRRKKGLILWHEKEFLEATPFVRQPLSALQARKVEEAANIFGVIRDQNEGVA